MQKEIICTECANRCKLLVEQQGDDIIVTGNYCPRGLKSGREEFLGERVVVHGIVRSSAVEAGKVPVHTSKAVQKGMVYNYG
jgi:CxxC motif-containing protein